MENQIVLKIAIHGTEETRNGKVVDRHNLHYGVDTGSLLAALTNEQASIVQLGDDKQGTLQLRAERTHEWELVLEYVITGVGAMAALFVAQAVKESASILTKWAIKQFGLGEGDSQPVFKVEDKQVAISRDEKSINLSTIQNLLTNAAKEGNIVVLVVDPNEIEKKETADVD